VDPAQQELEVGGEVLRPTQHEFLLNDGSWRMISHPFSPSALP
jgi:hypothetical protein